MSQAFETNEYRNVFAAYGYDETEIQNRMKNIWETIFFGSDDEKFYFEVGDDMGFVTDTGNNDVRSEGQSYAMMAAVQMDNKDVFDRVWKWTKTYMWLPEGKNAGYFAWSVSLSGEKNAWGPAPDGELFFAMALFFASNRWGNGEGIFNYSQEARDILHAMVHNEEPMYNPENKLIKFVPNMEISDPSYHCAHFHELFALWANEEDRDFFKEAAKASRDYLVTACHPITGLNPEYGNYDGTPFVGREHHHLFYSDSYRVAINIGLDHVWFGENPALTKAMERQQTFFYETHPGEGNDYAYEVDGTRVEDFMVLHPVGLLATNAVASLATDIDASRFFVEKFWNTPLRTGDRRYYDNFLYLFCFMALSGNYRIYK